MAKMYFQKGDDEVCYSIDYWKDYLLDNELKSIELFGAERETGTGYFYCKEFQEVGQINEGCGKICHKYKANNGKNGRCKHYGYVYGCTSKLLILTN